MGGASDWSKQTLLAARPIRSTDHIWVVTRYQCESHFVANQVVASGSVGCALFSHGSTRNASFSIPRRWVQMSIL